MYVYIYIETCMNMLGNYDVYMFLMMYISMEDIDDI